MRLHYLSEAQEQGGVLTSLPIVEKLSADSFDLLCRLTAKHMEKSVRHSQIAVYLRQEHSELTKPKAQLLSFLYSALSMADFCRQNLHAEGVGLYKILVSGDYDKISFNGNNVSMKKELRLSRRDAQILSAA